MTRNCDMERQRRSEGRGGEEQKRMRSLTGGSEVRGGKRGREQERERERERGWEREDK